MHACTSHVNDARNERTMNTNETNVTTNDATNDATTNDATQHDALTTTQTQRVNDDANATTQRAKRVKRDAIARVTNHARVASNASRTTRVDNVSNVNTIDDATRERRIDALCHELHAYHNDARTIDTRKQQKTTRRKLRALSYFISQHDANDFSTRVARHAKRVAKRETKNA